MRSITFGMWAAMALISAPLAAAQSYTATDLGTLGGGNYAIPQSISDSGAVVGYATLSNGIQHAFVWTSKTGMQDIGTLDGLAAQSAARGINNSGEAIGFSYLADGKTYHAFLWTRDTGMHDLGTLGGTDSAASGINDAGEVVGGASLADGFSSHAFLWTTAGGMEDLGTLGGTISYAQAISDSGEVVGYSYLAGDVTYHAFMWTEAGGMQDLGAFDDTNSGALAVNMAGQIAGVGYAPQEIQSSIAARWNSNRSMHALGAGSDSVAMGINASDQIVGYYYPNNTAAALLWTPEGHAQDLNNLIPPNSGWLLIQAWSVNQSGQIVASGTIGGATHAALLTPTN
jgi:probable HAF family extracellular repeat protein